MRLQSYPLLMIFLLVISAHSFAQKPVQKNAPDSLHIRESYLEMKGIVKESKGEVKSVEKPVDSALITIYLNDVPFNEMWTNKKGKCSFKLPLDKIFRIEVSRKGYVTKFFEVNTKVPGDKHDAFSFMFEIDIFEEIRGLDVKVLEKPIAKVSYNHAQEQFAYDVGYTSRINFDLKKMYKNYYMLQKVEADSMSRASTIDSVKIPKKK
jgi:hypothetical protein